MSTNIESLPLLQATIGVGPDEDFVIALGFTLADGATPLSLAGIAFSCAITELSTGTAVATLTTGGGEIVISGGSSNLLTITALAAARAAWPHGVLGLFLTATDGTYTKDVFASSTATLGNPSPLAVQVVRAAGASPVSVAAGVPPLAAAAIQAIVAAYLASLPTTVPGSPGQPWLNGGVLQVS